MWPFKKKKVFWIKYSINSYFIHTQETYEKGKDIADAFKRVERKYSSFFVSILDWKEIK